MQSKKILWQKESKHKNALYTNICLANGCGKQLNEIYHDVRAEINAHKEMKLLYYKSNDIAVEKRKLGLNYFSNRNWDDAIDWFNESLCFAEIGTKFVGIAYADRSACFFNMKMYEKCLVDIELAKNNNYPKDLMAELEKRKQTCLKRIAKCHRDEKIDNLQLHSSHYGYFAGESDKIMVTSHFGQYSIEAKRNIEVGEIIAMDKAFTKTLYTIYGWKCNICLKNNTNLVPCKRCTTAMFCIECENNALHKYECRLKTSKYSSYNNYVMHELRTFFVAMNLFTSADQMMEFVEHTLSDTHMSTDLNDERSRYKIFLKLTGNASLTEDVQFVPIIFCVYKILLEIPKVQNMFTTKKHRRFLMHIIGHHVRINLRQSYTASKTVTDDRGKEEIRTLYSQVGLMLGFMKQAYASNTWPVDRDGDTVYIALRPILSGEQLSVNYFGFHWNSAEKFSHEDVSQECCTELCACREPTAHDIESLTTRPDYQFIISQQLELNDETMNRKLFFKLKESCENILREFGRTLSCPQLHFVSHTYAKLLTVEFNGTLTVSKVVDQLTCNNNA